MQMLAHFSLFAARSLALAVVSLGCAAPAFAQLSFNLISTPGMSAQSIAGFQAAADRWSSLLGDNARVNISIDFRALGAGVLGGTSTANYLIPYDAFKTALSDDRKSSDDVLAVSSLAPGSTFGVLTNYTTTNPNGAGSPAPYVDNNGSPNNSRVRAAGALLKALGLLPAANAALDATIVFSTGFAWDFDPSNGIDAGAFDFIGVAMHEIGHALGFSSGVDLLDTNSPNPAGVFPDESVLRTSALDLFRYSALSTSLGVIDGTADPRSKYFSLDGGATAIAEFSTGVIKGDGRQASHWKDVPAGTTPFGLLDPTSGRGELQNITPLDLRAFDVIGWDLAVPEPSTYGLVGSLILVGIVARRRRKQLLA